MTLGFIVGLVVGAYFSSNLQGLYVWAKTKLTGLFGKK